MDFGDESKHLLLLPTKLSLDRTEMIKTFVTTAMAMLTLALAVLGALLDTTKPTLRKKVIIAVLFLIMTICATLLLFLLLKSQWETYFNYLQEEPSAQKKIVICGTKMSYRASHIVWQCKAFLISFLVPYIGTALIYEEYIDVKTNILIFGEYIKMRTLILGIGILHGLLVSFLQFPICLTRVPGDLDC